MAKFHPEYDALYAAVCAAPDDDTPRLVLADWLDEHDDPHRAALIRAQVGVEQAKEADPHAAVVFGFMRWSANYTWATRADPAAISPGVARLAAFEEQERKHESKAAARWKELRGKGRPGRIYIHRRGFPYGIQVNNASRFAAAAKRESPEPLPGYDLFVMNTDAAAADAVIGSGRLAGARGLSLYGLGDADAVRLFGVRPEVRNVRELSLDLEQPDAGVLAALAEQPNWSGLERLEVYADEGRFDLPASFFGATHLRTLTALTLSINGLSGAGLAGVTRLGLTRLRELDVGDNAVNAAGAAAVASGAFPELRSLDLGTNQIGSAGAKALADGRKLPLLAALDLADNSITDPEVISALIAGPAFPALAALSLRDNRVRELDPKRLAAPGRGPMLRLLSLRHCALSAASAAALATAPSLAGLVALDFGGNRIGDKGAAALARNAKWDNLTCLDLAANKITGKGVAALVEWPALAKLALLDLGDNPIGLDGAQALAGCKALKNCRLIALPLDTAQLPAVGRKLLEEAYGRRLIFRG